MNFILHYHEFHNFHAMNFILFITQNFIYKFHGFYILIFMKIMNYFYYEFNVDEV